MPHYKGHEVEAIAKQQEDGQWTGQYIITDYTETVTEGNKGKAEGTYTSREEAEAAALKEGQQILDSRPPLP